MNIVDVETAWISMVLPVSRGLSVSTVQSSTDAVCRITTDDGIHGIGESRGGPLDEMCEIIDTVLKPLLLKENPVETEYLWQKMYQSLLGEEAKNPKNWARRTILGAIGAVDLALWDIKGKMTSMSICQLLGGHPRPMPAYLSEGFYIEGQTMDEMVQEAADAMEAGGYSSLKIRIGRGRPEDSEARVKAIRDGLGEDIDLMADVNQAWDVKGSIEACKRLEDYNLFWLEEPIPVLRTPEYDPDKSCGEIADATSIPIASGENHIDLAECHSLTEYGGISYMQFDAIKNGGITEYLKVASVCQAHGIPMTPHHVAHFHIQLAAAVPNGLILETFDNAKQHIAWPDLFPGFPEVEDGHIKVPDRPGWGMEINDELIEKHGVKVHWRNL